MHESFLSVSCVDLEENKYPRNEHYTRFLSCAAPLSRHVEVTKEATDGWFSLNTCPFVGVTITLDRIFGKKDFRSG